MTLSSPQFRSGEMIPLDYTADGRNVSPPLQWTDPPAGTKSFALICEDPDAPRGVFYHWVVYEVPAQTRELEEKALPLGAKQGLNSFGDMNYGGPAPPRGQVHHYHFRLYALDVEMPLIGEVSAEGLKGELQDHILAESDLIGIYQRHS
jgi:Raf kinase inhibitor-like YbhB/YbcL family protein